MTTFKMLLEENIGDDLNLLAIHASLEPYFLAYKINTYLNFRLQRHRNDLILFINGQATTFVRYDYYDRHNAIHYYLFENIAKVENVLDRPDLFNTKKSISIAHFIGDRPKVDYFIKVVEGGFAFNKAKQKILKTLNQIPQIVTAYSVSVKELKTKENLIFE